MPGARWYNGKRAQKMAEERRKHSKRPRINEKTWVKVFALFNDDWSPEQIASQVRPSIAEFIRKFEQSGWTKSICDGIAKNDGRVYQNERLEI